MTVANTALLNPVKTQPPVINSEAVNVKNITTQQPPTQTQPELLDFTDYQKLHQHLVDRLINLVKKQGPIEDDNFRLEIADIRYKPTEITPEQEKRALLAGETLYDPLRVKFRLVDKQTGNVVSESWKRLVAIPKMTSRGTYILNGVEYGFVNQLRLRPGIYFRYTDAGDYEAMVNTAGVTGHRIILDPKTEQFYFTIRQARVPLFPILEVLGFTPKELQDLFGVEVYKKNAYAGSKVNIRQLAALLGEGSHLDAKEAIQQYFSKIKLDPRVVEISAGVFKDNYDKETVRAILNKLLAFVKGEDYPGDRNHLAFIKAYTPDMIIYEAIERNWKKLKSYFNNVRARRDLKYLPSGIFDSEVQAAIYGSGLGNVLQEINPVEIIDSRHRTTRLGPGGIPSHEQISDEVRYTHPSFLNYLDPILTSEGESVGVDSRFTIGARRDAEGNIYSPFIDRKTGQTVYLSPFQLFNKVVTFPGELESGAPYVRAIVNNQHILVRPEQVDYVVPYESYFYSLTANLVPMKRNSFPHRISMGSRMSTQAVPLVEPESPLVRNYSVEKQKSFDEIVGESLVRKAPVDGEVVGVTDNQIHIKDSKTGKVVVIDLYKDFPYNRKTFYDERLVVSLGQRVRAGDIIAKSNFTDNKGVLALGRNLKTAYIAWKGMNFEDAAVISESAAKKFTSEHAYQHWFDKFEGTVHNKTKFMQMFPGKYAKDFYEKYDENGIIKVGQTVEKGQPLALIAAPRPSGLSNKLYSDISLTWDFDDPGIVTAVYNGPKHINILVKAIHPLKVGDKISGRYGDKHIISAIIPDEQMPKDEKGEPFELLLNPLGVQGRVNVSQLWELLLGKVAKVLGKPIDVPEDLQDTIKFVEEKLKEVGLNDTENVQIDNKIKVEAPTGYRYVMKLHHMAESKLGGRSIGQYTSEGLPVKGGEGGAKRIGLLEMLGILAHGAYNVARDARVVRGQKNEDFWMRVRLGYDIPKLAERPFIYDKFLAQLTAMGLYPLGKGDQINFFALTDKDIDRLTEGRIIKDGRAIEYKGGELKPVPGGLFDPKLTGGLQGSFWSAIELPEPLPNPLVEPVLRSVLGFTEKEFLDVLTGKVEIPKFGKGPKALYEFVKSLNIDKMLSDTERQMQFATGKVDDALVRKYRFLKALKDRNLTLADLFWTKVPVLPPVFRPVSLLRNTNVPLVADANWLYKNLLDLSDALKQLNKDGLAFPEDRALLYRALKALVGLAEPVNYKLKAQGVKGILQSVIGSSPKEGVMQKKLLGSQVDLVGRATIIPNPDLKLDEVSLPEELAWTVYEPFVVRALIRRGMQPRRAVEEVQNRTEVARKMLEQELVSRPVIISRAPVLHKYGVMAAWPKLTSRNVIEIHPFLVTGFGADFDGDAMQFHVPVDPVAVQEAIQRMLPSRNLITFRKFEAGAIPTMEYAAGLYHLSRLQPTGAPIVVSSREELLQKLKTGEISPSQRVILKS